VISRSRYITLMLKITFIKKKSRSLFYAFVGMLGLGCATRFDQVFSEYYAETRCDFSSLCQFDSNFIGLELVRKVSAGLARTRSGQLRKGCSFDGAAYECREKALAIEKTNILQNPNFNAVIDGFYSSTPFHSPSPCELYVLRPSGNEHYLTVDKMYDFSSALPSSLQINDVTGLPLQDFTEITMSCSEECFFDVELETASNQLSFVVSDSRYSGRLKLAEKNSRIDKLQEVLQLCHI